MVESGKLGLAKLVWEANSIMLPQVVRSALPTFGKCDETSGSYLGKRVEVVGIFGREREEKEEKKGEKRREKVLYFLLYNIALYYILGYNKIQNTIILSHTHTTYTLTLPLKLSDRHQKDPACE